MIKSKSCNETISGDVKFAYFNARSIVNKYSELELMLTSENPDLVGITETWLTGEIQDTELNFSGYGLFRNDRNNDTKTRGGGVALLIKNELLPSIMTECSNTFEEIIWCNIYCNRQKDVSGSLLQSSG